VWEERAYRTRRDIAALGASGLGVSDLHNAAIQLIENRVGTDLTCWATIDPETLVISAMTGARVAPDYELWLAESEYSANEPHTFATLAQRRQPMARFTDLSDRDRTRSIRFNEVWRPLGVNQELRVLFLADGACWGAAGMVRTGRDFTDRESEFLTAVAPAIASATRLAVRSETSGVVQSRGAAIVVVGAHGELRALTTSGQEWQERFDQIAPGRFLVMMQVMAVGARAVSGPGCEMLRANGQYWKPVR
jgi:hypothetical protein